MRALLAGAAIGVLLGGVTSAASPPTTPMSAVMETSLGDVLIEVDPRTPQHADLFELLVGQGAYDGSAIGRVTPGYYAQLFAPVLGTGIDDVLPLEPTSEGNVAWTVSMNADENTEAAPSLTIVVVDSPQLDATNTPFGHVTAGFEVVLAALAVPTDDGAPVMPITVSRIYEVPDDGSTIVLRGAPSAGTPGGDASDDGLNIAAAWLAGIVGVLGLLQFAFARRMSHRIVATLGLLVAEVAFIAIWATFGPRAHGNSALGLILFVAVLGNFWLMGRFERRA
jgi:peptidyl-prolyl cis-trans isomerase B (cyclophilin B)